MPVAATSYDNWKLYAPGEFSFPPATLTTHMQGAPVSYGFGDFFQTGRRDLVTASINYWAKGVYADEATKMSDVEVWRDDGAGRWTRLWSGKGCLNPRKLLVADFNNDKVPDVFLACTGWDGTIANGAVRGETSRLLLSNGRDGFTVSEVGLPSWYMHRASAADLDHDGYADIVAADQIVLVLHAGDAADAPGVRDLARRDVAQADVTDQPLLLQLGERGERFVQRSLGGAVHVEHRPQVDHLEPLQAQVAQVVVHRLAQLLRREGRVPGSVRAAHRAHLGHDHQVVGIEIGRAHV